MSRVYKLKTVDVWDTLLRRKCHPDLIKLAAARYLLLRWHERLEPRYGEHWEIFRQRCLIEGELAAEARKGGTDDEYTLHEVLSRLLERVLTSPSAERPQIIAALVAAELALEKANTFPDAGCRALLGNHPARRTLFLSDFYMPAGLLAELLAHHGLDDLAPEGISSCDVRLNKRSGQLYRHVHRSFGLVPDEHLHIGDNEHSDVRVPGAMGIRTIHYQPPEAHAERIFREGFFPDRGPLLSHLERTVATLAESASATRQGSARAAFLLGSRAAPLLIGYCIFIAERCLVDRLDQVFFLTREGEFFLRVFRALFPEGRLAGIDLPPMSVLEASRLATFCASLQEISTDEMMRLWNLYSTQSIFSLSKSLGIAPQRLDSLCARYGLALHEEVVYPWQDERVRRLFGDPEFVCLVAEKSADDRTLLLAYLNQHGFTGGERRVGIVDIGWRGTIQDNLAMLMPDTIVFGYYLGLARFLNRQPPNCRKHAFGPDLNRGLEYNHFLDAVSPMEMLCNSPHGSVEGYRREASGRVVAQRHIEPDENAVFDAYVSHFQEGVLLAARQWAPYLDNHALASAELRPHACAIWDGLLSRSSREFSEAYASLSHNEVFGVGQFIDKRAVPSPAEMLRGILVRRDRLKVTRYLKQTQWGSGLWQRSDLGALHKAMLVFALSAGRLYKRARLRWVHGRHL